MTIRRRSVSIRIRVFRSMNNILCVTSQINLKQNVYSICFLYNKNGWVVLSLFFSKQSFRFSVYLFCYLRTSPERNCEQRNHRDSRATKLNGSRKYLNPFTISDVQKSQIKTYRELSPPFNSESLLSSGFWVLPYPPTFVTFINCLRPTGKMRNHI